MADAEVTLEEIYAEVDKRIAALKTELLAALALVENKIPTAKEKLQILRKRGA